MRVVHTARRVTRCAVGTTRPAVGVGSAVARVGRVHGPVQLVLGNALHAVERLARLKRARKQNKPAYCKHNEQREKHGISPVHDGSETRRARIYPRVTCDAVNTWDAVNTSRPGPGGSGAVQAIILF